MFIASTEVAGATSYIVRGVFSSPRFYTETVNTLAFALRAEQEHEETTLYIFFLGLV